MHNAIIVVVVQYNIIVIKVYINAELVCDLIEMISLPLKHLDISSCLSSDSS